MKTFTAGSLRHRQHTRIGKRAAILIAAIFAGHAATAASVNEANVVDLITHADTIVVGTVLSVSDGFDAQNVPYTEVTITVSSAIRSDVDNTVTFRQFGLLQPRQINGRTYLGTSPEGWPQWQERESVMVFLTEPAGITGLQTTVGLGQGKLSMRDGRLANEAGNQGMFKRVTVGVADLTAEQQEMLQSDGKAVDSRSFIDLVTRAVNENWIEQGVMQNEN